MAITFIQGNQTGSSANDTTTSCAFTSNVTAGNLLVVALGYASTTEPVVISDTLGNTYSTAVGPTDSSTIGYRDHIFYVVTGSGGANTVTAITDNVAPFRRLLVHEYSGVDTLDAATGTIGSSGAPNSGSVSTAHADELIFGWGVTNNGTTSAGSGFTLRETALSESTEDMIVSTTGSYSAIYPDDGSAWICQVAAFYQSSGASSTAKVAWLHV